MGHRGEKIVYQISSLNIQNRAKLGEFLEYLSNVTRSNQFKDFSVWLLAGETKFGMRQLRFWLIITGVWLTFFFNIERIIFNRFDTNIIRSDTYIFVAIVALLPLLLPRLHNFSFSSILIIVTVLFLYIWYQSPRWGQSVTVHYPQTNALSMLTILQVNAIILTGLLSRQISYSLNEFEYIVAKITFGHIGARPTPFAEEQSGMYREVRRAARYGRPLVMIAIKIDEESIQTPLPQMVKDVQKAMMKEFTLASIAESLDENLLSFDTIALRDNCFIITMPETSAQDIPTVVQRLESAIKEKFGIAVGIGAASFPNEAVTFEHLVELAIEKADPPEQSQYFSKMQTNGSG